MRRRVTTTVGLALATGPVAVGLAWLLLFRGAVAGACGPGSDAVCFPVAQNSPSPWLLVAAGAAGVVLGLALDLAVRRVRRHDRSG